MARSDQSAATLEAVGATVHRGSLDDLDALTDAPTASDGVIHLAFKHDQAFSGNFDAATDADRTAIAALGDALAGSDRPLVIASGLSGLQPGRLATERDRPDTTIPTGGRARSEVATLDLAERGVRSSSLRLPPTVHGAGDKWFIASLIALARERGLSGYIGDGANTWPAVHRLDAAHMFRLAVESAPAGSVLHGVAEQGVATRTIAEAIGRGLHLPVVAVDPDDAGDHFGWLAGLFGIDAQASSDETQALLGWRPTQPGLIDDLDQGHYFTAG